MDFLESAKVLIPALSGIALTIYDRTPDILTEFEHQYCFSQELQEIYTASWLKTFLKNSKPNLIYDLAEPLGSRLMVFYTGEKWVLIGPYVEEGWDESAARILLARLGASESVIMPYRTYHCKLPISGRDYALNIALLIIRQLGNNALENVKTIQIKPKGQKDNLNFPDGCRDISMINKRYAMEQHFITAISRGETEDAVKFLYGFNEVAADLRFFSYNLNDQNDQVVGAAIIRTLIRMGAIRAGLNAVCIDAISQEYAQKMKYAVSVTEVNYLKRLMVERICAEVRTMRQNKYSLYVRKAIDYITINLSQPLTIADISSAAGVDRHLLTRTFKQETGMTIKQYLAKRRCEIAADLLRDNEVSVQEVAAYVGYLDNNYFSKVFKANQGVSPQSCQRSH